MMQGNSVIAAQKRRFGFLYSIKKEGTPASFSGSTPRDRRFETRTRTATGKSRWALTLDGRQQHYERQQPDYHPQGPFGRFADHLSAARRLSRSALAS